MITFPRLLARQFRVFLRRCLQPPGPREPPLIRLQVGPAGLELAARQQECVIVYRQPGKLAPQSVFFPADLLADIEGKDGSVTLEADKEGQGEARWEDGGVPRSRSFHVVLPEKPPPWPEMPSRLKSLDSSFLSALAEAIRTTARDGVRYALTRIQLRGQSGQLVATDGRQLLVQGGFSLPWTEDVLLPALPLFASRDLPVQEPVAIGRTAQYVCLGLGPWTFHLEIDASGRFPRYEDVFPRVDGKTSRLQLSEDDADFLVHVLPRLPGDKDDLAPVTLELGKQVLLRARAESSEQVSEVLLASSTCVGPAIRVACNRRHLWRAAKLGFRELLVNNATTPLLCRDATRTYLFMPLERALPPASNTVCLRSDAVAASLPKSKSPVERRKPVMPRSTNSEPTPDNGAPRPHPPSAPGGGDEQVPDPLVEAEELRSLLHEAQHRLNRLLGALKHQRRHSRALRAAVDSLRNLRLDR